MTSSPQMNKLTPKTRKAFLAAGLLSGAALTSIVFASPASAANCFDGTFADLGDPTKWVGGVTGVCGDKAYTFIGMGLGTTNFLPTDKVNISETLNDHLVTITSDTGGWFPVIGNYTFNYKDAINTGTQEFASYNSGITSPNPNIGSYSITGTGTPPTVTAILPSAQSPSSNYGPGVKMDTFFTTLIVDPGSYVTQINTTLRQRDMISEVPGPLPLLGAGAAFGFSRRIRSRIKASA